MQAELANWRRRAKEYEQVLKRFPDFEEALVGFGGVCIDIQKPELAVAPLEHATRLNPDDEVAWYRLATADARLGKQGGAAEGAGSLPAAFHHSSPCANPMATTKLTPQHIGDAGTAPRNPLQSRLRLNAVINDSLVRIRFPSIAAVFLSVTRHDGPHPQRNDAPDPAHSMLRQIPARRSESDSGC